MLTRVEEKRRHARAAAAYPAAIRDRRGRVLARGRTANISESGVFVVAKIGRVPPVGQEIIIDLTVPAVPASCSRRPASRTVCYRCRVVRAQRLGNLAGLGVEFLEKLA